MSDQQIIEMWCKPCRATRAFHCAHPGECGNMLPIKAEHNATLAKIKEANDE